MQLIYSTEIKLIFIVTPEHIDVFVSAWRKVKKDFFTAVMGPLFS
jgi:hypothetical protein